MESAVQSEEKTQKPINKILLLFVFPLILGAMLLNFLIVISSKIWHKNWSKSKRVGLIAVIWGVLLIGGTSAKSDTYSLSDIRAENRAKHGECVGPDGKRLNIDKNDCDAFNNAWKNPKQEPLQQIVSAPTNTPTPTILVQNTPTPTVTPIPTKKVYPTRIYTKPTAMPTVQPQSTQSTTTKSFVDTSSGSSSNSGGDKDCSDFNSHAEAQAFFLSAGAGDPHDLDRDGDGSACDALR